MDNERRLKKLIGARIRRLRKEVHGWSQLELAKRVSCERSWISQIETGNEDSWPAMPRLAEIAAALGVSLADLVRDENDSHTDSLDLIRIDKKWIVNGRLLSTEAKRVLFEVAKLLPTEEGHP